jgi:hypothetical protein
MANIRVVEYPSTLHLITIKERTLSVGFCGQLGGFGEQPFE